MTTPRSILTLNNVAEVIHLPDVSLVVAGWEGMVDRRLRLSLHGGGGQRKGPLIARRHHALGPEHLRGI